jgi:putative ABC transport system ATP-binding protein
VGSCRSRLSVGRLLVVELLSLRGVSKSFVRGGRPLPVMADVSLEVGVGEIVAVEGSRYSGKTTLLRVAAGIVSPDRGEVWLGDCELTALTNAKRKRLLGREIKWVDREGPGTRLKICDAIALPLMVGRRGRDAKASAGQILERVGISDCAGQMWEDLSFYETVLAGLALGIAGCPRLLVMDDLLDALGRKRQRELGDLLRSLVSETGCGVLMSVPDLDTALIADRVASLHEGELVVVSDQSSVNDAEIIDFPSAARLGGDSRGVGS